MKRHRARKLKQKNCKGIDIEQNNQNNAKRDTSEGKKCGKEAMTKIMSVDKIEMMIMFVDNSKKKFLKWARGLRWRERNMRRKMLKQARRAKEDTEETNIKKNKNIAMWRSVGLRLEWLQSERK